MARTYVDSWSSSVTTATSPYYIGAGNKTTMTVSGGLLQLAPNTSDYTNWQSCIVRGTVGSTSSADALAPQGNCAMQFTVNMTNLVRGQSFITHAKASLATQESPILYRIANEGSFRLMWTVPGFWNETFGNVAYRGDFSGRDVSESGTWTMIILRKDLTASGSYQKLIATTPTGVTYRTGWFPQNDDGHQLIGLANYYFGGTAVMPMSAITVVDQLTLDQINAIDVTASADLTPMPIADHGTGEYGDFTTVTLTAPADLDPDYTTIRYTLDGSTPTTSSTLYTGPITVGSPFTPGTTVTLKCAYFGDTLGKAQTKTLTYTFKVLEPVLSFFEGSATYTYSTVDFPLTWKIDPPTATEYWYTLDGTDPQTSGTAIKWAPGAVYPFNSHPDATIVAYGRQQQLPNYLKVRAKYLTTNAWSAMTRTWTIYFSLTKSSRTSVTVTGGFNRDAAISYNVFNELGVASTVPVTMHVTINGVETTHTAASGNLSVPFGEDTSYSIYAYSDDGLLSTSSNNGAVSFGQAALSLDKTTAITSASSATIEITNPNPSATTYYTVDGSTPTASSSSSITPITSVSVPNGSMLKAVSKRGDYTSAMQTAEVFPEYEVADAVTATVDGSTFHYYAATQRCELNSPLGETTTSVTVGSNTSNVSLPATIDGTPSSMFLWDIADQRGTINTALSSINVSDFMSKFWSRLAYSECTAVMNYGFDKTAWMTPGGVLNMAGSFTMFRIKVASKTSVVVFDYVVDCDTYQTTIVRKRGSHGAALATVGSTQGKVLATGTTVNNALTLVIGTSSISISDGTATSTEALVGQDAGVTWYVEGMFNPNATDIPAIATSGVADTSMSMSFSIDTTATSGLLRRAPATVFAETSTQFEVKNKTIKFSDKDSVVDQDFYVPCGPLKAHASVGYDVPSHAALVEGPFEWKLPYVFDGAASFDVSVDFNARFIRSPGQDITLYVSAEGYGGSAAGIDIGSVFASMRSVIDVDNNGVEVSGSSAIELYAGSTATRVISPTAQSRFKLRIAKEAGAGTATVYGYVGDAEVILATPALGTGYIEFKLVRKGKLSRPDPMKTLIFGASMTGTVRTKTVTSMNISGAHIMRKGVSACLPATALTVTQNAVKAVFFNTTTSAVSVEDLAFEPSDGRVLIGVIDTRNESATWTSLLFSRTVRVRAEASRTLGTGSIIGAGAGIYIENGRATWQSSGYKQSALVGDTNWIRPYVYVDLFRKKQVIRTFERQPVKLTLSTGTTI